MHFVNLIFILLHGHKLSFFVCFSFLANFFVDQSTHEQKYKDDAIPALDEILKAGRVHVSYEIKNWRQFVVDTLYSLCSLLHHNSLNFTINALFTHIDGSLS